MHKVTINEHPFTQICKNCPHAGGTVTPTHNKQRAYYGPSAIVCSLGQDAACCPVYEARHPGSIRTADDLPDLVERALRERRRKAANPDCKYCAGSGETLNLKTKEISRCKCLNMDLGTTQSN